jgi:hypothetical protein
MCYHGNTGDYIDYRGDIPITVVYLKNMFEFYKK